MTNSANDRLRPDVSGPAVAGHCGTAEESDISAAHSNAAIARGGLRLPLDFSSCDAKWLVSIKAIRS